MLTERETLMGKDTQAESRKVKGTQNCSATWLEVSDFMVMGLVSMLSLANHSDLGSFLMTDGFFLSIPGMFFTYDGFYYVVSIKKQLKDPKQSPKIILIGMICLAVIFILITLSLL